MQVALVACSMTAGPCVAQEFPNPNAELQRQEEQRQILRQRNEAQPEARLQASPAAASPRFPAETPCVLIHSVKLVGDGRPYLADALAGPEWDDPPQGRCLGAAGVRLLQERVQNALVGLGYITSTVQALPQSLAGGELILTVRVGKIGRVMASTADGTESLWPSNAIATGPGKLLNLRDVEQSLENLRRNPGADADFEIRPADADGLSDILIRYQRGRSFRLDLSADDSGSRTTGKWQGNATFSWDNPLGWSDSAYVSLGHHLGGVDAGPRGSSSQVVHYSVPVGYWLLSVTGSRNSYHQTIVGAFQSYLYSGSSTGAEFQLGRVVHRGATTKTSVSLKAFARGSNNFIDDTEVEVQRRRTGGWEAALQNTLYVGDSTLSSNLSLRRGTGAFGAMPAPEESFGEGTSRMQVTQGAVSLAMPLRLGSLPMQYSGQLRMQWNHTPLTSQDQFCVGGRNTVRGFDGSRSLCGERGQLLRNEVSAAVTDLPIQAYAVADIARVRGSSLPDGAYLAGGALGLRGALPLGAITALQWDAFVGRPLHRPTGFELAGSTFGMSFNASF